MMIDDIKKVLDLNIEKAYKGREIWIKIVNENDIKNKNYVVLMPTLNRDYNYYTLLYLNQFYKKYSTEGFFILTFDKRVIKSSYLFSDKIIKTIEISQEDAQYIIAFYNLYYFTDKLVISALDTPNGRTGMELIGQNGMTIEEIFAVGICRLKEFNKEIAPEYNGKDYDVISFLNNEMI